MKPQARKKDILHYALHLAEVQGYTNVTREDVAAKAGVTGSAIHYHFSTMSKFRTALMRYAVQQRSAKVVAQGLSLDDPEAASADVDLLRAAQAALTPQPEEKHYEE
jgi:AcrR family transcriptional regulator